MKYSFTITDYTVVTKLQMFGFGKFSRTYLAAWKNSSEVRVSFRRASLGAVRFIYFFSFPVFVDVQRLNIKKQFMMVMSFDEFSKKFPPLKSGEVPFFRDMPVPRKQIQRPDANYVSISSCLRVWLQYSVFNILYHLEVKILTIIK